MEFDKSKVYTAVNADELKPGDMVIVSDVLSLLEKRVTGNEKPKELSGIADEDCLCRFEVDNQPYGLAYLVERAPNKKWRAYKACDEMVEDFKLRYDKAADFRSPMWHPLIWVKRKDDDSTNLITYFGEKAVTIHGKDCHLDWLFNNYTYLDESPCGKEE